MCFTLVPSASCFAFFGSAPAFFVLFIPGTRKVQGCIGVEQISIPGGFRNFSPKKYLVIRFINKVNSLWLGIENFNYIFMPIRRQLRLKIIFSNGNGEVLLDRLLLLLL